MKKIEICKIVDNIEEFVTQLLLAMIVILLGMQVFFRDLFNLTIAWNEELSRFVFIWFVYFAMCYATKKGNHIRVLFQFQLFTENVRKKILAITDIVWILFDIVMIYKGVEVVIHMFEFPNISPTLNISLGYIYCIFPIAFTLNVIRNIQYLLFKKQVQ